MYLLNIYPWLIILNTYHWLFFCLNFVLVWKYVSVYTQKGGSLAATLFGVNLHYFFLQWSGFSLVRMLGR